MQPTEKVSYIFFWKEDCGENGMKKIWVWGRVRKIRKKWQKKAKGDEGNKIRKFTFGPGRSLTHTLCGGRKFSCHFLRRIFIFRRFFLIVIIIYDLLDHIHTKLILGKFFQQFFRLFTFSMLTQPFCFLFGSWWDAIMSFSPFEPIFLGIWVSKIALENDRKSVKSSHASMMEYIAWKVENERQAIEREHGESLQSMNQHFLAIANNFYSTRMMNADYWLHILCHDNF